MHNKILNKNFKLTKFNKPYPFAIFNNFFEKNFYQELEKSIPLSSEFLKSDKKVGRFDVDISYESKLYKKILETNNSFKKIHNYIYSNEFLNFFLKLFEEEIDDDSSDNIADESDDEEVKAVIYD